MAGDSSGEPLVGDSVRREVPAGGVPTGECLDRVDREFPTRSLRAVVVLTGGRLPDFEDETPIDLEVECLDFVLSVASSSFCRRGMSKICRVDLSEVAAMWDPDGEKASEKMIARSTPLLNSQTLAPSVDQTLISVP